MPDNNDDLRNRLAVLENQLGLRDNTNVNTRNVILLFKAISLAVVVILIGRLFINY